MTTSLEFGCDCLGEITQLDAVLNGLARAAAHYPQRDLGACDSDRQRAPDYTQVKHMMSYIGG